MNFERSFLLSEVHIRFLISLFAGIILAIMSLAGLMNFLLHNHPVPTWSVLQWTTPENIKYVELDHNAAIEL